LKSDSPPKTSLRWISYGLLAVAALAASLLFFGWARLNTPNDLDIFFTCDVHGRLVPCGCFSGQMGGLTRIATLIGGVPRESSLKVDVGGALDGVADYQVIQYRYLLRAFHEIGYEAANLGHPEARLSAAQLREIKASSPVPLLSANLLERASGAPLFDAYRIVQRGAYRIALVGVMDEHIPSENLGEGLAVEPMQAALSRLLPTLRKAADFIVLLAFTDEARLRQLARDDYEIQVILGGNVSQPAQHLEHLNCSYILYTTNQSRALGSLVLSFLGPGKLHDKSGEIVLVADTIAEDPAIRKLDDEYRAEIRQTKLQIDDPAHPRDDVVPGVKSAAQYVGSESCMQCHVSAGKTWQDSRHAQASRALLQAGADADPNCLGCHTVGFGAPSGYRRDAPKRLTDVGCESCHGPGSVHVAQHAAGTEVTTHFRPLGVADCQKCHHGEFSRPFDWSAFWPQIQHGLEESKK
jgi:hypothetical protein